MTAKETLEKYGLATDVKSIKKRIIYQPSSYIVSGSYAEKERNIIAETLKYADLSLLCELAEKGERYDKAVKKELENAQSFIKFDGQKGQAVAIEYILKAIITEAEGEPR